MRRDAWRGGCLFLSDFCWQREGRSRGGSGSGRQGADRVAHFSATKHTYILEAFERFQWAKAFFFFSPSCSCFEGFAAWRTPPPKVWGGKQDGATFSIMMEIFSQSSRPAAFTIGGCLSWAGLFIVGIAFPFAEESLGPFCFLLFATVLSGSGIFFYLFLPETKGKSAVEITEEFNRSSLGKKLDVLRKNFSEDHSVYSSF